MRKENRRRVFKATRVLKLDFLGEEWKDAFVRYYALSVTEMREMMRRKLTKKDPAEIIEIMLEVLKSHFVEGLAPDGSGELIKLEADDLENMPTEVLNKSSLFLVADFSEVSG